MIHSLPCCWRFVSQTRFTSRSVWLLAFLVFLSAYVSTPPTLGQSTFGAILGTVKDPSGNVVPNAQVSLLNKGTSAMRTLSTDDIGSYSFQNVEPSNYELMVTAVGFQKIDFSSLELQSRETKRIDLNLKLATATQTITVEETAGAVVTTDVSNLSENKTGRELIDLPVAIASRGTGSTSPFSTLTTQPGVQTDASGNISIAGTSPVMLSINIDGISSMGVSNSAPIGELFPSFNSIAEIRISEANNSAEFGGISDITTVSKSGTNTLHGGIFENHQNAALDAGNPFSPTKPKLIMNDFGGFLGGPISIPKLYNGHSKTFFFLSYEGLRLPREVVLTENVPSTAFRQGDLSSVPTPIYDPATGQPFPNNQIPVNPVSARVLQLLFPVANAGAADAQTFNYVQNFPEPISSNQGDLRLDQYLSSKHTVFARFTYKRRAVITAPTSSNGQNGAGNQLVGTALIGGIQQPEIDYGLTIAYNYIVTPSLVNEVRTGFSGVHSKNIFGVNPDIINRIGITGLPPLSGSGSVVPNFAIGNYQPTGGVADFSMADRTIQVLDNITWTKGKHTVKVGGDYRYLNSTQAGAFLNLEEGIYNFNGSVTSSPLAGSSHPYVGNPFAAFLLGIPDQTQLGANNNDRLAAYAGHYSVFGQDDWKVTPKLTLNIGLRWEYHPMFQDHLVNVTNFLPDYYSVSNGVTVRGAVVVPNQQSLKMAEPGFIQSISPTPVLTAQQAGIPVSLRYSQRTDFAPRFGFAWRPFGNDKTVLRGGYGRYMVSLLGGIVNAQWAVHTTNYQIFNQSIDSNGTPALQFPSPFQSDPAAQIGTQFFLQGQDLHYADPYVQQWQLTVERDLGFGTGLRVSYIGNHGSKLGATVDLDQIAPNTVGYAIAGQTRPFPLWGRIQTLTNGAWSNYNALSVAANKRFSHGLQFQTSYVFARNLSNVAGVAPTGFAVEQGGILSNRFDPGLDYGNVAFTRRNRFLTTFLYELPFGRQGLFLKGASGLIDRIVGGWELAGVALFQSGPFLTATTPTADPSGTNFVNLCGCAGRPDAVAGVSGNLPSGQRSVNAWFSYNAFSVPADNIGRYGTASVGSLVGPGTQAISLSLIKTVQFTESIRLQFGAEISNAFNHPNYDIPNTNFTAQQAGTGFGQIGNLQSAEGSGPRAIQLTARISF
jgi:hypothetical protein